MILPLAISMDVNYEVLLLGLAGLIGACAGNQITLTCCLQGDLGVCLSHLPAGPLRLRYVEAGVVPESRKRKQAPAWRHFPSPGCLILLISYSLKQSHPSFKEERETDHTS